jgi:hypothetical protein
LVARSWRLCVRNGYSVRTGQQKAKNLGHIAGLDSLPYPGVVRDSTIPTFGPKDYEQYFQSREVDYTVLSQESLKKLRTWFKAHDLDFYFTLREAIDVGKRRFQWYRGVE